MPDEFDSPSPLAAPRARGNGRFLALGLLVALALGAAVALWGGREAGWIDFGRPRAAAPAKLGAQPAPAAPAAPETSPMEGAQAALGVRLAELEQRMAQLNLQAEAASGNAARAEGLLIAFAARRAIERGGPLGYLESQLKLRFGDAQPNAVETLIEASAHPVTLDVLEQGLTTLAPALAGAPGGSDAWTRLRHELAGLFVLRKVSSPSPAPQRRLERARMFLDTGRVEAAIGEVERMPGHAAANEWLTLANRYVRAQRALDLIETAAILEPHALRDGAGEPVATPSPLATPNGGVGAF